MFDDPEMRVHSREVEMAVTTSADALVKLLLTMATIAAENNARERRQRWEREQEAAAEKQWRERAAAEPWLRAPYDDRFWDNLEPTPEGMRPLGRAWQTAYEWGGSDPQAAAALHHMREKIHEKYGVRIPDDMLPVQDLSRAIALSDPNLQEKAEAGREAAAESGQASYLYVIEDPSTDTQLATGEIRGHDWEEPDLVAAHAHQQWVAGTDGEPLGDNVVIRVYENTGGPVGGKEPLAVVEAQRVPELLKAEEERQRRVAAREEEASPQEVLHAMSAEHRRAGERAEKWQEARDRLADADPAELPEGEHDRQVDTLQQSVLRERRYQAALNLDREAVEAEQRGEDPALVYRGASLRARLDQGLIAEVSPAEAAGLWSEVNHWSHGAARDQALDAMNEKLVGYYGLELDEDVNRADAAAALESMVDVKEPGEPEEVRKKALELNRRAGEKLDAALRKEAQIAGLMVDGKPKDEIAEVEINSLAAKAEVLRGSAEIDRGAAGVVEAQADRLAASEPSDPAALPPGVTKEQVVQGYQSQWGDDPQWASWSTTPPAAPSAPAAEAAGPATDAPAPAPAAARPAPARQAPSPVRRGPSKKALKTNADRQLAKVGRGGSAAKVAAHDGAKRVNEGLGKTSATPAATPSAPAKGRGRDLGSDQGR
ncbi:hypothetical protein F7Q99_30730 [Streptomyces kaniharaensis]|uniref:Uncharacterized protein n=1 Tax=Streptomyces kaniharaensis TaxID=212423 RepID=A0A6N7L2V4_9ACTN|nr:hypothetical protein [Streptomyces kaniharaensis]MQS16454.1 hypothetical protein [Streptomyces kaniharaensis]